MTRASGPFAALAVGYLAFVAWLTLSPVPWRTRPIESDYDVLSLATWLDPGTWSGGPSFEFAANIALFVPLGFLVRLGLPRATWLGAVAIGIAVSFAIEVAQMATPRVSDPRDIVSNALGALVGALAAALLAGAVRVVRRAARRRATVSARS